MESNKLKIDLPSLMIAPLMNKHKIKHESTLLQSDLIKKGYISLRLWTNESGDFDIDHYKLVGPYEQPDPGDFNIEIALGSEEALYILDHYLNTVKITPNPFTAPKKV